MNLAPRLTSNCFSLTTAPAWPRRSARHPTSARWTARPPSLLGCKDAKHIRCETNRYIFGKPQKLSSKRVAQDAQEKSRRVPQRGMSFLCHGAYAAPVVLLGRLGSEGNGSGHCVVCIAAEHAEHWAVICQGLDTAHPHQSTVRLALWNLRCTPAVLSWLRRSYQHNNKTDFDAQQAALLDGQRRTSATPSLGTPWKHLYSVSNP